MKPTEIEIASQTDTLTQQSREAIEEVFLMRGNAKNRKKFLDAVKDIKPARCITKVGWVSGDYISFTCIIEKNGEGDLWDEIAKGVEDKIEMLNFIYGLGPKVFDFDPFYVADEPIKNHFGLNFKLRRDDTRKTNL